MRYVFRRRVPDITRILLVESGSRAVSERVLPLLRRNHGAHVGIDIVTCYPGVPSGFQAGARVFRVADYAGSAGRKRLYRELRAAGYSAVGIICSAEPIMTKWKWAVAAKVPAKVFIINENADYFWLDYSQSGIIAHFALLRCGLSGSGSARNLASMALFPFTLLFLLLYAAGVHLRRAVRSITSASSGVN